jgi:hypothetical protein
MTTRATDSAAEIAELDATGQAELVRRREVRLPMMAQLAEDGSPTARRRPGSPPPGARRSSRRPGARGVPVARRATTVCFETHKADADAAPLFRGLRDDRCQCPHWGVVVSGKVTYRYADHDETYVAGDAYYGAPGHLPLTFAGTELIEFSPTEAFQETMAVVAANLAKPAGS